MNDHLKVASRPLRPSKIDVIQAFHRLRMDPDSEYLTAFRTRFGTFRWKVLPFGLKVGPAWFQQFINAQLHDLLDRCASAYADDVLIYSDKEEDHWKDCQEVIWRLHQANLQGDIKKSRFNVTKVDYLGVLLEAGVGLSVDPRKVRSIQDWKFEDLRDRTAIRSFVGLCNFIRVFCYHASGVAEPLNRLLKKDVAFVMGPEQREAFDQLKRLAIEAPVLAFFRPELPTRLETDASRNATAGVLWQEQPDQTWKPVGFFSKTMTPAERAYPIQDRELLAVVQSLEHFYPELLGQKFDVITDHEALVHFSTKRLLSVRQIRWSDFLAQFDIRFLYRPGRLNVVADALSRKTAELPTVKAREAEERTVTLIPPERLGFATDSLDPTAAGNLPPQNFSPEPKPTRPLVLRATSALQTPEDRGIQQTPDQDRPELDPNSVPKGAELVSLIRQENLLQDLGTHGTHLIVPAQTSDKQTFLQTALIREAHEPQIFAHAGQNKVIKLLQRDFYWPRMKEDIRRYIRNCHDCRRNKTPRDKTPGLLHPLPVPTSVWEHVECDGKDMPKDRYGYDYVWTFVCKLSRIIATLPGKKNDTAEVLASRYFRYLYRFFGMPSYGFLTTLDSLFLPSSQRLTGSRERSIVMEAPTPSDPRV
ncbi:reverse transcriptase (RNA-dependent DNA polymerase) domain-containing protein [Hirsutella rhossiliensis]|uniref:Reverse transcriptase (RNA-dependent DNA polymerase) domain-containing protein n=1 Tax=Hirsutella rhossiliensis TaxID=111463 RepID=A0A9P8SJ33_9HYPO|nr:reverse transcriptase (RNA-dependent DNA polymerase) domain-containing protein [Hirsutella rhossiliensis]KAH0962646.1 reverse transcriptase (RNA-dependent DNA polymerase) domain-containing protein [Hirsutella rhossiliensis]